MKLAEAFARFAVEMWRLEEIHCVEEFLRSHDRMNEETRDEIIREISARVRKSLKKYPCRSARLIDKLLEEIWEAGGAP